MALDECGWRSDVEAPVDVKREARGCIVIRIPRRELCTAPPHVELDRGSRVGRGGRRARSEALYIVERLFCLPLSIDIEYCRPFLQVLDNILEDWAGGQPCKYYLRAVEDSQFV